MNEPYGAAGLRLGPVALHDILEGSVLFGDLWRQAAPGSRKIGTSPVFPSTPCPTLFNDTMQDYTKDKRQTTDGLTDRDQTDLGHDVDSTHEQLVEVAVHQQLRAVDQRVLEARPDLLPQLARDVQLGAQGSEPQAGQVVHLQHKVVEGVTPF